MRLTKPLFNDAGRSQIPRLHEIERSTSRRCFKHDKAATPLSQADPERRQKMPAAATSRLLLKAISRAAESVQLLLFAIVSWLVAEALAGFAAYGMAMYATREAMDDPAEPGAPQPSTPTLVDRKSRPL
jgi:hypothetical protein